VKLKPIVIGLAAAVAIAVPASATDLFMADQTQYVAPAEPGFDWQGFYVGVYGSHIPVLGETAVGKLVGGNIVLNDLILFGAEARVGAVFDNGSNYSEVAALGRAGVILGDRVLLYAIGGVDRLHLGGGSYVVYSVIGGGGEVGLGENWSARAEVTRQECIGTICPLLPLGTQIIRFAGAAIWHFD